MKEAGFKIGTDGKISLPLKKGYYIIRKVTEKEYKDFKGCNDILSKEEKVDFYPQDIPYRE